MKIQFGCIFYRDPIDSLSDKYSLYYLINDVNKLRNDIGRESANGGGNARRFCLSYKEVSKMAWRNWIRLIIHIADAPAHHRKYCFDYQDSENHEEEPEKILTFIKKMCRRRN